RSFSQGASDGKICAVELSQVNPSNRAQEIVHRKGCPHADFYFLNSYSHFSIFMRAYFVRPQCLYKTYGMLPAPATMAWNLQ
ncbi:MAG TPA: hypothetical protein VGQ61_05800, partial [Candidatus Angelobacter sp.]|nr:hypothetical protein [Candidatus Angelobacter sp.]